MNDSCNIEIIVKVGSIRDFASVMLLLEKYSVIPLIKNNSPVSIRRQSEDWDSLLKVLLSHPVGKSIGELYKLTGVFTSYKNFKSRIKVLAEKGVLSLNNTNLKNGGRGTIVTVLKLKELKNIE